MAKIVWKELFYNASTIKVWGSAPEACTCHKLFKTLLMLDTAVSLFIKNPEEVAGDQSLIFGLILTYNQVVQQLIHYKNNWDYLQHIFTDMLTNTIISSVSHYFDKLIKTMWIFSITDPVIDSDMITTLIGKINAIFPTQ